MVGQGQGGNGILLEDVVQVGESLLVHASVRGDQQGLGVLRERGVVIHRQHLEEIGLGVLIETIGLVDGGRAGEEFLGGLQGVVPILVGCLFLQHTRDVGDLDGAAGGVQLLGQDALGLLASNLIQHIYQTQAQGRRHEEVRLRRLPGGERGAGPAANVLAGGVDHVVHVIHVFVLLEEITDDGQAGISQFHQHLQMMDHLAHGAIAGVLAVFRAKFDELVENLRRVHPVRYCGGHRAGHRAHFDLLLPGLGQGLFEIRLLLLPASLAFRICRHTFLLLAREPEPRPAKANEGRQ